MGCYAHAASSSRYAILECEARAILVECCGLKSAECAASPTTASANCFKQKSPYQTGCYGKKPKNAGTLYALYEPEVDCISKGIARMRCES